MKGRGGEEIKREIWDWKRMVRKKGIRNERCGERKEGKMRGGSKEGDM